MSTNDPSVARWASLLDVEVADVSWERSQQARLTLGDRREVFAKAPTEAGPLAGRCQAAEVAGLRWLGEGATVQIVEVVADGPGAMATTWIEPGAATPTGAEEFGRALAGLHRTAIERFGAPWPGCIGPLAQSNEWRGDWVSFYGEQRLAPMAQAAGDVGALSREAQRAVEEVIDSLADLAGPPEAPCRLHGDLWSGNVLWAVDGTVWLIDPSAHGGHRETDLAMLALFGVQHLDRILGAYREEFPLSQGWRRRVGLHQLYPLLVHAVLFGSSYGRRVADICTELLALRRPAGP